MRLSLAQSVESARMTRMNEYTANNNTAALRLEICMADERSIKVGDVDFICRASIFK